MIQTAKEFADAIEKAAGKQVATPAEVARVVEAVFGSRMRMRHEQIRSAMRGRDLESLIRVSGLPSRPATEAELRPADAAALALISPPAPSARYSFAPNESPILMLRRKPPWAVIASVAIGLLVGAVAVLVILSQRPPKTVVVTQPAPSGKPVAPMPTVRRVVVPLPFLATHVTFDDESRDLEPAADVTAFEVSRASGQRHRVSITALDGSKASGYVRELDGVARVEPEGFSIDSTPPPPQVEAKGPQASPAPAANRASRPVAPQPVGTVKNGFTKLR